MTNNKVAVHDPEKRDSVKWVPGPAQKKIADLPAHMVGVVRRDGTRVGRVSRGASASVAERLLGKQGVELKDGAWHEKRTTRVATTRALDKAVHAASLRAAKGSLSDKPHAPRAHARPHRGG